MSYALFLIVGSLGKQCRHISMVIHTKEAIVLVVSLIFAKVKTYFIAVINNVNCKYKDIFYSVKLRLDLLHTAEYRSLPVCTESIVQNIKYCKENIVQKPNSHCSFFRSLKNPC